MVCKAALSHNKLHCRNHRFARSCCFKPSARMREGYCSCPVCVSVCLSVCLLTVCPKNTVTYSVGNVGRNICGDFSETASFQALTALYGYREVGHFLSGNTRVSLPVAYPGGGGIWVFEHPPFASPRPLCLHAKSRLCYTLSSEMVELISYVDPVAEPGGGDTGVQRNLPFQQRP